MILDWRARKVLRNLMDDWLPPVIRESPSFRWATSLWLGAYPDLKDRAFRMSDAEFVRAYAAADGIARNRASDTTAAQAEWIASKTGIGQRVLEIGAGAGALTRLLERIGNTVFTLELQGGDVIGTAERIPLAAKSIDVIVLAHVLEHVRSLTRTMLELQRVARRSVLIVAPKQRFYRWTFDYHLHFFYSLDHLASHIPSGRVSGEKIDGDLCLVWELSD